MAAAVTGWCSTAAVLIVAEALHHEAASGPRTLAATLAAEPSAARSVTPAAAVLTPGPARFAVGS